MKVKYLPLLLSLAMVFALFAGCGGAAQAPADSAPTASVPGEPQSADSAVPEEPETDMESRQIQEVKIYSSA